MVVASPGACNARAGARRPRARQRAASYDETLTNRGRTGRALKPLALCLLTMVSTACVVPVHDDFRTPQDAVLTFQSRFARDDVAGERDCFSQRFIEQNGASLQVYATVRDRFLAPLGTLGRFILRRNSLVDNLEGGEVSELHARLVYSLFGHAFEIVASREAAFRFPDPVSGAMTTAPLRSDWARLFTGATPAESRLYVKVQVPAETAQALVAHGLPWAELVNGWKLEIVAPLEGTGAVKPIPEVPAGEMRPIAVDALRVHELKDESLFGAVRLRVELPLGEAAALVRALPDGTLVVGSPPAVNGSAARVSGLRWTAGGAAAQ